MSPSTTTVTEAYTRYAEPLLRYLMQRVDQPQDAEDLLHEVFVRLLEIQAGSEAWDVLEPALLYRIAHGRTIDWQRSQRYRRTVPIPTIADGQPPVDEQSLTRIRLTNTLTRLSPRHREVIAWRFVRGASLAETAAALGLTPPVVKARQQRALARLRTLLQRDEGECGIR